MTKNLVILNIFEKTFSASLFRRRYIAYEGILIFETSRKERYLAFIWKGFYVWAMMIVIMIMITIIIKSHKIDTAKNKIVAPKGKPTRWLVNGFLSHEVFAFFDRGTRSTLRCWIDFQCNLIWEQKNWNQTPRAPNPALRDYGSGFFISPI